MAGQQNYTDLTIETYKDRAYDYLKDSSKLYFLKKRFGIGDGVDKDKIRHYQLLNNILCSEEIQLIEWVDKKIKGELGKSECCNKIDSDCYCNIDSCSANECLKWEKVEW